MNIEDIDTSTIYGLVIMACIGIGPILKDVIQKFLRTKIRHSQEIDSIRVLEEKSKLEERDKSSDFFKEYLMQKDKDFEILKDILIDIKDTVQQNQFTNKKDFQSLVISKIELMFLKLESSISNIIDRNHIVSSNIETSYKKITNLIDRNINDLILDIDEVHYHDLTKKAVTEMLLSKKKDASSLLNEVITDYVEAITLEKTERKDNAIKQLKESINYLNNSFISSFQKTIN